MENNRSLQSPPFKSLIVSYPESVKINIVDIITIFAADAERTFGWEYDGHI